jgi:hypothetical protein
MPNKIQNYNKIVEEIRQQPRQQGLYWPMYQKRRKLHEAGAQAGLTKCHRLVASTYEIYFLQF